MTLPRQTVSTNHHLIQDMQLVSETLWDNWSDLLCIYNLLSIHNEIDMTKLLISCFLFLTCDEWEVHTSHEDGLLMLYIEVLINESVDARYQHRIKIHITVKKS